MRKFCAILCLLLVSACAGRIPNKGVLHIELGEVAHPIGGGSGFAIDPYHVVTAGHVCVVGLIDVPLSYNGIPLRIFKLDLKADLCLLESDVPIKDYLTIAEDEPDLNDRIVMLGYPLGIPVLIPTEGRVVGLLPGSHDIPEYVLSCPGFAGNSGGPILNDDGEVIGVLVSGVPSYFQLTFAVTLGTLRNFLGIKV